MLAGSVHGEKVDGRGRTAGHDAEGRVGILSRGSSCQQGKCERDERGFHLDEDSEIENGRLLNRIDAAKWRQYLPVFIAFVRPNGIVA